MVTVLDEARQATILYQAVLARVGALAAASMFRAWQGTAQPLPETGREAWRLQASTIVDNTWTVASRLGLAYYQLTRALITGSTIAAPGQGSDMVALAELRERWERLTRTAYGDRSAPDGQRIGVESLEDTADRYAARRADALGQVQRIIAGKAVDVANRRVAEAGDATDLTELRTRAGESVAAAADRIAKGGGRGEVWDNLQSDPRAIGYARISSKPPPCYWCAILISQGKTYATKKAALVSSSEARQGDEYHDHCNCIAVPLFADEQYEGPEFDQSRAYRDLWDDLMKKNGKDSYEARRALRRLLYAERRAAERTTPAAPEAAA